MPSLVKAEALQEDRQHKDDQVQDVRTIGREVFENTLREDLKDLVLTAPIQAVLVLGEVKVRSVAEDQILMKSKNVSKVIGRQRKIASNIAAHRPLSATLRSQ